MAQEEDERQVYIDHPNRRKAGSKVTKFIVIVLLLVSVALVVIISLGGWGTIEGAKPVQIAYVLLYIGLAFMVLRWSRGVLPLIAALAIVLLIFAAVSGPAWFDRDKTGLTSPALDESVIGLLCLILIPVQILLIAFSMRGFQQAWNVEVEYHEDDEEEDAEEERRPEQRGDAAPAPA